MNRKLEIELELRIATAVINDLVTAGFAVSVNNGEDETTPSIDAAESIKALFQTDEDLICAYQDGVRVGWVLLIYGNVEALVSDYTMNLEWALISSTALADTYS